MDLILILEYLKVFLSPQDIAGAVVIVFIYKFNEDIKALMLRVAKIKLPGGTEFSTLQSKQGTEDDGKPTPAPPPGEVILPNTLKLPENQVQEIKQLLDAERARSYLWEYRYLNYLLVYSTQQVLDWLYSLQNNTTTYSFYDAIWLPMIPDPNERSTIIRVLQAHHLVILARDEILSLSPKGREYIVWRGPLPQLPFKN